ncbi:MAG: ATP phosphoribosyltransferase [Myxococcota bacterium]
MSVPYAWPAPGSTDHLAVATQRLRHVEDVVLGVINAANYVEVTPPTVDVAEVFTGGTGAPRWVDSKGRVMSVRSDFTGPVARIAATRLRDVDGPLRLAYRGSTFDSADGGVVETREAGAELFGISGPEGEAAVIQVAVDALRALGLRPQVAVGSVAVVDRVLPSTTGVRLALHRRDRKALLALPEVQALTPERRVAVQALLDLAGGPEVLDKARAVLPGCDDALDDLAELLVRLPNIDVTIDLAHVRTPTYYTGAVFDIYVPGGAGPVAGGGRYDALVGRYGASRPAVGVSLDLDTLALTEDRPLSDLTFGLPKGRMLKALVARLGEQGPTAEDLASRRLVLERGPWKFLPLKDPDVPVYVERGVVDVGVVGSDVLAENGADVLVPYDLGLGKCRLCLCGPADLDIAALHAQGTLRVASKYAKTAARALAERGLIADIVPLQGSVEVSVLTGMADAIVDLVETGKTLEENNLVVLETLAEVSAHIIVNRAAWHLRPEAVKRAIAALMEG